MKRTLNTALLAIAIAIPATAAFADMDKARAALVAGEIQPLPKILESVARKHPGDVMEVELERERGRWIYEIKILQSDGKLLKLDVDAKDAAVIDSRESRR
ncbi:MAG: PepSY domain-containing protein [Gammaproteobacteria bacterium]